MERALYGSFLPMPKEGTFGSGEEVMEGVDLPGAMILRKDKIAINAGRERVKLSVTNTGDRPIQVSTTQLRRHSTF